MKPSLVIAGIFSAAAVVASSSDAHAAGHANGFGEKGQLILSADRLVPLFNYTVGSVTEPANGLELTDSTSGSGISLLFGRSLSVSEVGNNGPVNVHAVPRVAFDVTIIPRLTLGAAIAFGFGLGGTNEDEFVAGGGRQTRPTDSPTATAIGLAPRVGYILPLGDIFAFWPRLGFGFYSVSTSFETVNGQGAVQNNSVTDTLFSLDLDPQFVLVPLEHFFIHGGPLVNVPISGTRSRSSTAAPTVSYDASLFNIGLSLGLGGWFNVF